MVFSVISLSGFNAEAATRIECEMNIWDGNMSINRYTEGRAELTFSNRAGSFSRDAVESENRAQDLTFFSFPDGKVTVSSALLRDEVMSGKATAEFAESVLTYRCTRR